MESLKKNDGRKQPGGLLFSQLLLYLFSCYLHNYLHSLLLLLLLTGLFASSPPPKRGCRKSGENCARSGSALSSTWRPPSGIVYRTLPPICLKNFYPTP